MRNITFKTKYLKQILLIGTLLLSFIASAQLQTPFTPRYSEAINGDMTMIANNVTSAHPTNSYTGGENNQDNPRVFVDIDSDTNTFNSSSANFVNPSPSSPCLLINKAYLYWSAADKEYGFDNGNLTGDGNPEPVWDYRDIKIMLPGESAYTTITADDVMYQGRPDHYQNDGYAAVKDITDMVNTLANPFGTYQIANLKATEGSLYSHNNNFAGVTGGWQIVFVYESPDLVKRNVTLFDGFAIVHTAGGFNNYSVDFDGFQTVPSGPVNTNILFGTIDGDLGLMNDQLRIEDTNGVFQSLSTPVRDGNNFFRSSITVGGAEFLDRNPASTNTLGYDAGLFPLSNVNNDIIGNNQTSATIRMTSSGDLYSLYLMGISVEVFEPSLGSLNFSTAVVGATFEPGETATAQLRIQNVGNDDIRNLEISATLPPQIELTGTSPLAPGITYTFDTNTREVRFFIPDGYTDVGDAEYFLDMFLYINDTCPSCSTTISIQALATFTGVANPNMVGTLSSGTVNACGVGNHDPTLLYVIPTISISDASTIEGNDLSFNLTSSHSVDSDVVLNLNYTNISAESIDYQAQSTFTMLAGTGSTTIPIATVDDVLIEPTETFEISISSATPMTISNAVATGSITDNDMIMGTGIAFTNTNVIVTEGTDLFAVYTVTLTGAISENVTVDYTTNEGTALNPGDFVTTNGTLTFTPTVSSINIQVPITDDSIIEISENFTVVLSNVQSNLGLGIVGSNTANTTINDDDGMAGDGIAFTNTNLIVTEGTDLFAVYTVTLIGAISENVTVDYTTNEGTALNSADFNTAVGTITFTPTISSFDIQVPITDDIVSEPTEGFTVVLSNIQSNLGIGFVNGNTTNTANGTINDDDDAMIMVEPYTEEHTIMCGEDLPEVPTLTFTGGCGNYTVDFSEVEEFTTGTDDYMVIRTWNVTDFCGNTASFQQLIFVMQAERVEITIDICTGDDAIDLLESLPVNFDRTGNFTVTQGDFILNGSLFEPTNLELGEYLITYESTDTSCKFYADYVITVNTDCLPCDLNDLMVSKTITINGDGINDYFEITGLEECNYTYQVMIFNRWGTKVFESNDYTNNWGGYAPSGSLGSSGILPTGTYYYMISLSDPEIQPINGYIYIGSE